MSRNPDSQGIPFSRLKKDATQAVGVVLEAGSQYGTTGRVIWEGLAPHFRQEKGVWRISEERLENFFHEMQAADNTRAGLDPRVRKLGELIFQRGERRSDRWVSLAGFFQHDIFHLSPREHLYYTLLELTSSQPDEREGEDLIVYERHKSFLEQAVTRGEQVTNAMRYPFEFLEGVLAVEQGKEIPKELLREFRPAEMLELIAFILQGRFAIDDYRLIFNDSSINEATFNRFIINADPQLTISTAEGMLFMVLYNLAKNAAKASSEAHAANGTHDRRAMPRSYIEGVEDLAIGDPRAITLGVEEVGASIVFTVADQGAGLSLDKTLQRAHNTIKYQLAQQQQSSRDMVNSEWYRNVQRALGDQVDVLLEWPHDPNALRKLKIGSILDLQFVTGFTGETWDIRSSTSGTGLWGVYFLTQVMGGTVFATNQFEGGAQFTVVLPKESLRVEKAA